MHSPRVLLTSLIWFLLVGVVACGDNPSEGPPTISASVPSVTVAAGATADVTATYTDGGGTQTPATDATFTVAGSTVASVTASGGHATVKGLSAGRTTLTIAGRGATTTIPVTVTGTAEAALTKIEVTPTNPSLAAGTTVQLTATGTYDDQTTKDLTATVTWSSAADKVTIGADGIAHGAAIGSAEITAKLGDISGKTTVTVTAAVLTAIEVTPNMAMLPIGATQQMVATGKFSDNTTQQLNDVTWTVDVAAKATISTSGLVTAVALGDVNIKASKGALDGTAKLTVVAAAVQTITVEPPDASLAAGRTLQYKATAKLSDNSTLDVTAQADWTSSVVGKATISNAAGSKGLATGVSAGDTNISAAFGGKTGTTKLTVTDAVLTQITVTPVDSTASLGTTVQFRADGKFSDNSTQNITAQVTWSSSAVAVATISNAAGSKGLATTVTTGETTITASLSGIDGTTKLTVSDAVLVSIDVAPATVSLPVGNKAQLAATGHFSDNTTQVVTDQATWETSSEATATVSNAAGSKGEVTAVAVGTATVTAKLAGITSNNVAVTVRAAEVTAIVVAPKTASIVVAGTQAFTATGTFTDHHDADVTTTATWTSSDTAVATVAATGVATGVAGGTATIKAAIGAIDDTATLTVAGLQIVSVAPVSGTEVRTSTSITVTFDTAMDPASLTTLTATDACSGNIQLSKDNFVNCIGMSAATAALDTDAKVATVTPAVPLAFSTNYQIRVLGTVKTAAGGTLGVTFTQAAPWKTAAPCAPGELVISQVYGGGGNAGPPAGVFNHDFIELHNTGTTPISLNGLAIQYNNSTGTAAWLFNALPDVMVPGGGYFLIQEAAGNNTTQPNLPTPDFAPTAAINMSGSNGRVALTTINTALPGGNDCAVIRAASLDILGWGPTTLCTEGTSAGVTTSAQGVQRLDSGCIDNDNNGADTLIATPTPRNSAVVRFCSCPLTGLDGFAEPQMSFLEQ